MIAKKILVIEDEEIIASVLQDSLELTGHDVTIASSGFEGISRAQQLKPDIITLDVMMPGLDGIQVLKELKSNPATAKIPVILISVAGSYRKEALKLGAVAFLKKPVDFNQLNEKISEVTEKKSVMIVEDNPELRMLLKMRLTGMGYSVETVSESEEVLPRAKAIRPDIILMDVVLPDENGFDITKRLKEDESTAKIPVIAFSGYFTEEIDNNMVVGVEKFLNKEFSAEELADEVNALLQSYEAGEKNKDEK